MIITIDRFEGEFAVCEFEDMTFANLPKVFLPPGAVEGSKVKIELDFEQQTEAESRIKEKMDKLFSKK